MKHLIKRGAWISRKRVLHDAIIETFRRILVFGNVENEVLVLMMFVEISS